MKKLMNKKENGITLVALVITIIVLIILAAVSINAVMNEGLIENAKTAKEKYSEAETEEIISLAYYTALAGGNGSVTANGLTTALAGNNITADVTDNGDGTFNIVIGEETYNLDKNGKVTIQPEPEVVSVVWTRNGITITNNYNDTTLTVGQVVNYTPQTEITTYTVEAEDSGWNEDQEIAIKEIPEWRVIGVDEEGRLELIPSAETFIYDSGYVYFNEIESFEQVENIFNDLCDKLYGDGDLESGSYCTFLKKADLDKMEPYIFDVSDNYLGDTEDWNPYWLGELTDEGVFILGKCISIWNYVDIFHYGDFAAISLKDVEVDATNFINGIVNYMRVIPKVVLGSDYIF